jgi:hypothetical protein
MKTPVAPTLPFATAVPAEILEQIVFGTKIARFIAITDPDEMPAVIAKRIWENVQSYLRSGDWPDRRRTAAEIDEEEAAS